MPPVLTLITQCYGQPGMVSRWCERHGRWSQSARKRAAVVIVDDHGDPRVVPGDLEALRGFASVELVRVEKDIPWNQMGARNLAVRLAPTQVIVMLDIDMIVEAEDAERFLQEAEGLQPGEVIKFCLRDVDRENQANYPFINTSSPNTWFLRKKDFQKVKGYNEDFAGTKGWSDVELLHTLCSAFRVVTRRDLLVSWHSTCRVVPDALVKSLPRDVGVNAGKHRAHKKKVDARFGGNWAKWARASKRQSIRFPWSSSKVFPSKT